MEGVTQPDFIRIEIWYLSQKVNPHRFHWYCNVRSSKPLEILSLLSFHGTAANTHYNIINNIMKTTLSGLEYILYHLLSYRC